MQNEFSQLKKTSVMVENEKKPNENENRREEVKEPSVYNLEELKIKFELCD
jgi:hypothetical protein